MFFEGFTKKLFDCVFKETNTKHAYFENILTGIE
jgi:hypothetical protein